jgi:hypothetical protein
MYCPSCGAAVSEELSFCNRCGTDLKKVDSALNSLVDGIFWTTVICLGLIFGGVVALSKSGVRDAFVIAYMTVASLAFLGLYGLQVWQFIHLTRGRQKLKMKAVYHGQETGELAEAKTNALPEAPPSIIENTTRTLEPVYRQKNQS